MKTLKAIIVVIIIVTALSALSAAQKKMTADDVFALIQNNFKAIRDYRVDAVLNADFDNPKIHISNSRATIYYKRPDKVKVVAKEGFAFMPETFAGEPTASIKKDFDALYEGAARFNGTLAYVLNLKPKNTRHSGTMHILVEQQRGLLLGSVAQAEGFNMTSRWSYKLIDKKFWLPSEIRITMDGSMPVSGHGIHKGKVQSHSGKGFAVVKLNNYRVNKGIPDSVFEKKKGND